jgi:dipeptidyl aminopeptidase/acylaminoacyl peptidase
LASEPSALSAKELFSTVLAGGLGSVSAVTGIHFAPDGGEAVVVGDVRYQLEGTSSTRVYRLKVPTGSLEPLTENERACERSAQWSRDGSRIAFLSDHGHQGLFQPWVVEAAPGKPARELLLPGYSVESLEWTADGRLVALAAEEGAEQGVTGGSGSIQMASSPQDAPAWTPTVHRGGSTLTGWRVALLVEPDSLEVQRISPEGLNVWLGVVAKDALLACVSNLPFEGDWTKSRVELLPLDGSTSRTIHQPRLQLGNLAASPDGTKLALIEGLASDRGLVAGDVVVIERDGGTVRELDLDGVDATSICFRDEHRIVVAGVQDLDTVVLEVDLRDLRVEIHHRGLMTTSDRFYPAASPHPEGGVCFGAEFWSIPPRIAVAEQGRVKDLVTFENDGQRWLGDRLGPIQEVRWRSADGLDISGFLILPREAHAPHPTVLAVHGGPAHCWRPSWPSPDHLLLALLSANGYAVFLPNPRGSSGKGQEFLAMELGDYGGAEVADLLTGLDHLVAEGLADPDRLGVYGVSHGGYMSCWLTTKTTRFRAAVAGSPVTDWYSQHFSSNIPDFDEMYLKANPKVAGGPYFERSPVFFAHRSKTPTLLAAGMVDRCTPPGQAVEFHQALLAAGVETELVLYPQEGHGVRAIPARIDMAERALAFFDSHLKVGRQ